MSLGANNFKLEIESITLYPSIILYNKNFYHLILRIFLSSTYTTSTSSTFILDGTAYELKMVSPDYFSDTIFSI